MLRQPLFIVLMQYQGRSAQIAELALTSRIQEHEERTLPQRQDLTRNA